MIYLKRGWYQERDGPITSMGMERMRLCLCIYERERNEKSEREQGKGCMQSEMKREWSPSCFALSLFNFLFFFFFRSKDFHQLLQDCWNGTPQLRPSFQVLFFLSFLSHTHTLSYTLPLTRLLAIFLAPLSLSPYSFSPIHYHTRCT